jgi:N-methylhydantoinase A/oxoprolinase/acetone carboxylase beta subunit
VQRGYDVTDYVLNSFGGAGGQHACLVADALGIGSRAACIRCPACCRPTAWGLPS